MEPKQRFNRGLSDEFITELLTGNFAPLLAKSVSVGLDIQIREKYVGFYHDGLSVLALSEHAASPRYRARIHRKYLEGTVLPDALTPVGNYRRFDATGQFVGAYTKHLPAILSNAQPYAGPEAVVEQKMIRASHGGASPVVFIDRQVQVHGVRKKADLVGLTAAGQFAVTELKRGLDNRIQHLMDQIHEYHAVLAGPDGCLREEVARSYRKVVQQKQALGLLPRDNRLPDERAQVTCLLGNGAMEFICKPFGDAASGKSLSRVIQNVLDKHRCTFPAGTLPADPPTDFRGGTLAFYRTHIELNGEIILESDGPGHSWKVMEVLRTPRGNGKLPHLSAPKLANAVDPTGQLTEGAIASCIHDMRVRICNTMLEKANVVVGREGVIANKNRGYHLAAWLNIESHDGIAQQTSDAGPLQGHDPAPKAHGPASERQAWILSQLRDGVKLQRQMVQKHFGVSERQAKRELAGLSSQGLIEFVRKPRPGYYRLGGRVG